jgi:uncharacterized protein YbjT (DUF2867 family)
MKVLVTGATGYIGGRLIPELLQAGHQVRVLVRDPGRLEDRPWSNKVEVHVGDLSQPLSDRSAMEGIEAAYYLVHSMATRCDFSSVDRACALNFAEAARAVRHVIYVGGLLPDAKLVSDHLASRAEVGEILARFLPVTEFRAGPIIGSGSASFEMMRYLTERIPVMVTPKWVKNLVQPIGIRAVLDYLMAAVEREPMGVVEIGANQLTFREMMEQYAEIRGLKRTIIPLPILAPRLAALWVGLVTPIPNSLAVPLVEGVVHPVVADTARAQELFPEVHPECYRTACRKALARIDEEAVLTRWSTSLKGQPTFQLVDEQGTIREVRKLQVKASPAALFRAFSGIGGRRGWLVWEWAWRLRGLLDQVLGGPGLRRGRRHASELLPGEVLDFWRVERVERDRRLVLRAEMRVPGKAWLVWESRPHEGGSQLIQTALFQPRGLGGVLYWYLLYPLHGWIFSDLARAIADIAETES